MGMGVMLRGKALRRMGVGREFKVWGKWTIKGKG